MNEIYQRGPVACGIAVPDALENYTGGIFHDTTGNMEIVHDISIVGFGVENGVKFWKVRNSWGQHWGENASCAGRPVMRLNTVIGWTVRILTRAALLPAATRTASTAPGCTR